jgi:FtsP/CotA-like multicopper oxidase with cupredoxin domain
VSPAPSVSPAGHLFAASPRRRADHVAAAQTVGTSWWHAHRLAQYTDGLFGPIVFHAANETAMTANKYDDEYTFVLNDMYNTQASALEWRFRAVGTGIDGQPGDEPTPDGGMINGVSQARCAYIPPTDLVIAERKRSLDGRPIAGSLTKRGSSGLRQRSTTAGTYYPETNYCGNATTTYWNATWVGGKTYRLRLVNAGTFVNAEFSIDNHTLTVIEADGVSVEPLNVSSINLAVAQRYSVLVTLDQPAGAYWIRNVLATDQVRYTGLDFNDTTLGVLRYEGVSETLLPANLPASSIGNLTAFDTTALVPAEKQDAQLPTQSAWIQFDMQYTSNNQHFMFINSTSWSPLGLGQAAIFDVTASTTSANQSLGDQFSVVNTQAGVFDLVVNSLDDGDHPFHLHGHTFQIMSQGDGRWTGDTSTLNTTNPMRRDTIVIPSYGHIVLRFATDNRECTQRISPRLVDPCSA